MALTSLVGTSQSEFANIELGIPRPALPITWEGPFAQAEILTAGNKIVRVSPGGTSTLIPSTVLISDPAWWTA